MLAGRTGNDILGFLKLPMSPLFSLNVRPWGLKFWKQNLDLLLKTPALIRRREKNPWPTQRILPWAPVCFQIGPNISFQCQEALSCCSPSLVAGGLCRAQPEPLLAPVLGPKHCRCAPEPQSQSQGAAAPPGPYRQSWLCPEWREKWQHFYCTRS